MLLTEVFLAKKTRNVVLQCSQYEQITFPNEFTFVFLTLCLSQFHWGIIVKKMLSKVRHWEKRSKGD